MNISREEAELLFGALSSKYQDNLNLGMKSHAKQIDKLGRALSSQIDSTDLKWTFWRDLLKTEKVDSK